MALKKTSALMNLGGSIDFVDGAAYAETEMQLPLDTLSREVWVVTDVQVDHELLVFDAAQGGAQTIGIRVMKNSQSTLIEINDPDCISSYSATLIQTTAANLGGGAFQQSKAPDEFSTGEGKDYLCIIATPNWFIGGAFGTTTGGASNRAAFVRLTGYRAVADTGTYSALIAEQLNA